MKKILFIFSCIIFIFTGCGKEEQSSNNYVNEDLQFSLMLPGNWENDFTVNKDGNTVSFYYGEADNSQGLFQITQYKGMDITDEDISKLQGNTKILYKGNDVTYVGSSGYEIEDGDKGAKAPEVLGDINKIFDSFQTSLKEPLQDEDKPYKFRYVGSLFYEGYIPNYFNSRPSKTQPMTWEFTLQDKVQGTISFIPYGSGTPDLVNDEIYVDFKKDVNLKREVRIAFTKDYIEEYNFQIFVNSVRFLPGPENSVDMMTKIKESGKSGLTPELLKVSGYSNGAIETEKGLIRVGSSCPVVPVAPEEYKYLGSYTFYPDCESYFKSGEFEKYKEKTFYVALNSQGEAVGLVADTLNSRKENKEEDGD